MLLLRSMGGGRRRQGRLRGKKEEGGGGFRDARLETTKGVGSSHTSSNGGDLDPSYDVLAEIPQ